jgi:hypothetical protein
MACPARRADLSNAPLPDLGLQTRNRADEVTLLRCGPAQQFSYPVMSRLYVAILSLGGLLTVAWVIVLMWCVFRIFGVH